MPVVRDAGGRLTTDEPPALSAWQEWKLARVPYPRQHLPRPLVV